MKLPRGTLAIVAASVLGGACTLLVAGLRHSASPHVSGSQWIVAASMGLLAMATWIWPVVVFRGCESETFHMDEGIFVVLAILVPPLLTLGTLAVAIILAQTARRRPVVKSAFNAGQVLIAAGLGLIVSRSMAAPTNSATAGQIAASALGVVVYFVVNTSLVNSVMVSMGTTWTEFGSDLPTQMTLAGTAAFTGIVLALAIHAHLWAVALAVPAFLLLRRLVSARYAALYGRARMEGLYEVALAANRRLRHEAVLDTILESVRQLLRSPQAIVTPEHPGSASLAAPMTVAGQRQWLVASGRRRDEPFDGADLSLLRALAAVGDGAMSNAELYEQVRIEREKLASITLNIGDGVCALDARGKLTFVNPVASALLDLAPLSISATGEPAGDSSGLAPDFLLLPATEAMRTGGTVRKDDARFRGKNGGILPVAYTASAVISDGTPSGAVLAFRDITERKAFEDELHHHAFHDSLTGLANRRLLVQRLDRALLRSTRDHKTHALIFVDVDRFKSINDNLGHVTGDEFLVAIAGRIGEVVRSRDLLARFGGDEFVLLLEDVRGVGEAAAAARRVCTAVEQPLMLSGGYEVVATVSVGVALTEPGKTADDVLHNADVAMYEAKARRGGIYKVFDQHLMGARSPERLRTEADLRKALERHELEVYYQPFYSLGEQHIVGAEALVRWRHPTNGLINPMRFIPMAEETGLILPLGRYVLEQACQQVRSIRDRLRMELPISVNLSPRQFQDIRLLPQVAAVLDATGVKPELLIFEITETMVMDDLSGAREVMKKLRELGVRLAIDDFGTGHSSLAYLKQFPAHEVKVDRSFIHSVADSPVDSAIVRAIIDLADAVGILTVAEGVENASQVTELKMLGCQVAQGFYFSQPLQSHEFEALLSRHVGQSHPHCRPLSLEPGI
jgi:diguanylate cyclase (GGDEF)-like protein